MFLQLKTVSKTCFQIRPPSFSQTHCAFFLILSYVPMLSGAGSLPASAALVSMSALGETNIVVTMSARESLWSLSKSMAFYIKEETIYVEVGEELSIVILG